MVVREGMENYASILIPVNYRKKVLVVLSSID